MFWRAFRNFSLTQKHSLVPNESRTYSFILGRVGMEIQVRSEHRANQMATRKEQERRESHLKQFIARFGQGHKKMAKQAQSRQKMLAKLQVSRDLSASDNSAFAWHTLSFFPSFFF